MRTQRCNTHVLPAGHTLRFLAKRLLLVILPQAPVRQPSSPLCRYLVESIRKFPDAVSFAEQVQNAGFRFVDYGKLSGGVVAIHSGFKL